MLIETELGNANEREAKPKLNLYNEKGDLEGFQRDFKTFFLHVSVTLWHLSIREQVRKKSACTL